MWWLCGKLAAQFMVIGQGAPNVSGK
jgi:hypothetical protein